MAWQETRNTHPAAAPSFPATKCTGCTRARWGGGGSQKHALTCVRAGVVLIINSYLTRVHSQCSILNINHYD